MIVKFRARPQERSRDGTQAAACGLGATVALVLTAGLCQYTGADIAGEVGLIAGVAVLAYAGLLAALGWR